MTPRHDDGPVRVLVIRLCRGPRPAGHQPPQPISEPVGEWTTTRIRQLLMPSKWRVTEYDLRIGTLLSRQAAGTSFKGAYQFMRPKVRSGHKPDVAFHSKLPLRRSIRQREEASQPALTPQPSRDRPSACLSDSPRELLGDNLDRHAERGICRHSFPAGILSASPRQTPARLPSRSRKQFKKCQHRPSSVSIRTAKQVH